MELVNVGDGRFRSLLDATYIESVVEDGIVKELIGRNGQINNRFVRVLKD